MEHFRTQGVPQGMTLLLHLSDLHFGRTDPYALSALRAKVADLDPDALVVTGDLTQSGRRNEFEAAAAYLGGLQKPVAVVPGNHDAPVYSLLERFAHPWRRFTRHFGPTAPRAWDFRDVSIIGVNSARRAAPRLNWSYGKLRRADIQQAAAMARMRSGERLVMAATHHPFALGPGRAGAERVGRADLAVNAFVDAGVSVVLTGHVHNASIAILPGTDDALLSISAGSATSTRQRGETASFTALFVEAGNQTSILAVQYALDGDDFRPSTTASLLRRPDGWSVISRNEGHAHDRR